jgi:Reverse transcriptase (RNA-dependent DNA polymerase)
VADEEETRRKVGLNQKVEGEAKYRLVPNEVWRALPQYVLASCLMELSQDASDPDGGTRLAHEADRFLASLCLCPRQTNLVHEDPHKRRDRGRIKCKGDHVLKIHRNIYGQKQAGRVWNQYLVRKLVTKLRFKQSKVNECVFYRGNVLYVLYTDDSLIAGPPDPDEIEQVIHELQSMAKLSFTVEGNLADFLGVNIEWKEDGTIHLSQPHLIDQILKDLCLKGER